MMALQAKKRRAFSFARNEAGAAGVEFAFVIPVLLAGLFVVIEFSRVMYSKVEFEYAVFSATRFSSISKSSDTTKVQKALADSLILLNSIKLSPIKLTVTPNGDKTSTATLTAAYKVKSLLPLTDMTSITLTKTVSFLISG